MHDPTWLDGYAFAKAEAAKAALDRNDVDGAKSLLEQQIDASQRAMGLRGKSTDLEDTLKNHMVQLLPWLQECLDEWRAAQKDLRDMETLETH